MTIEELEFKEHVLRDCFKHKLEYLNVEGDNDISTVKCIKTFGALWHYTHQLLLAEISEEKHVSTTQADTMNIQATGLTMRSSK